MKRSKQKLWAFSYWKRLNRVSEFVEAHFRDEITLADAARIAGLEKHYFSAFFREKVGQTFSAWLADFRVTRAKELLSQRNWSVSEVAFEVGFGSLSAFERRFKGVYGMTPSEFKRSVVSNARD